MTDPSASGNPGRWILAQRPALRLAVVVTFYFTQGVPQALFYVVLPTWLSVNGYSVADIAAVVGAAGTPGTIKFLGGLFVDRFPYLPMGRRKPWILFGQALICGGLITGSLLAGGRPEIGLLAALGFLSMLGFVFQDVSIDSLIIDLFDEREQGRAAGLTYSAAGLGSASMIFVGGRLIESYGLPFVFAALATLPVIVFLLLLPLREREGERLTPMTPGQTHPVNLARGKSNWGGMLREVFGLILNPLAILVMVLGAARYLPAGINTTMFPVMATQGAGWELTRFTDMQTFTGLAAAILGAGFAALVLPRIGPRAANIMLLPVVALLYGAMALVPGLQTDDGALTAFFYATEVLSVLVLISLFPICMRMTTPAAAATQYALLMASFNLGRPIGAALSGTFGYDGLSTLFLIIAGAAVLSVPAFLFVKFPHKEREAAIPPDPAPLMPH
ncbi:MFS transporter [Tsuneonella sp. HG222]